MTEEKKNQEQEQPNATEAWNEVGKQFQTLGKSLTAALNATVQDEQVQQELNKMQAALDTTATQIKQKAKEASDSLASKEEEAEKLDEQAQAAGQELIKEVQPQLVNALEKLQASLDQAVNDLEQQDPAAASAESAPAWIGVGQQFQALGKSLTAALNATVQDEKVQQELKKMQAELGTTVAQIKKKVKEASDAAKSKKVEVGAETKKLDEQAQATGQDLVKEIQLQLTDALKKMQAGLDKIVKDLEQKEATSPAASTAMKERKQCLATTKSGNRCKNKARPDSDYCGVHQTAAKNES